MALSATNAILRIVSRAIGGTLALLTLGFATQASAATQAATSGTPKVIVRCTEIREEPGAPTFSFELLKQRGSYEARYLNLPGDPSQPPEIVASIPGLDCDFFSRNRFLFRCQKPGATIESVAITERTLSPIGNRPLIRSFREFRATGNEVPNIFLVFRFGQAATCTIRRS